MAATEVDISVPGPIRSMLGWDGAWYGVSVVALWVLLYFFSGAFDIFAVTSNEVGCKYFELAQVEVSLLECVYFFNR